QSQLSSTELTAGQRASGRHYFLSLRLLCLRSFSSQYFNDAHSWITASSLGMVTESSRVSTTPSAGVLAMLSSASPTFLIKAEIPLNPPSEVCLGSRILNATPPAWLSSTSRAS